MCKFSRTQYYQCFLVLISLLDDHEASVAAQRPATQSAFLSMDYPVGVPRDQRGDWILCRTRPKVECLHLS